MEGTFISALCVVVFIFAILTMRGTVLDITRPKENPWSLFWYAQLLLVLIPIAVVSNVSIEELQETNSRVLNGAVPGTETEIAYTVLGTITLYTMALSLFLRMLGLRRLRDEIAYISGHYRVLLYYSSGLVILSFILLAIFNLFGFKHAFLAALSGTQSLLKTRLHNAYEAGMPSQLIPMLFWAGYVLSILGGMLFRLRYKMRGFLLLTIALFIASGPGNKAPVIIAILLWLAAARVIVPPKLASMRSFAIAAAGLFILTFLSYSLYKAQYPQANFLEFPSYLMLRLGVGQMAGTYVTLGLAHTGELPQGEYYWALVPGASFVNPEYINYQKMLMIVSEGYSYKEIGVKNSYFISEACAIGGGVLLWLSPIIVAFSTALGILIFKMIFQVIFFRPISPQLAIVMYLLTHDITGGFAAFPLLKGIIVQGLLLAILFFPVKVCTVCVYSGNRSYTPSPLR